MKLLLKNGHIDESVRLAAHGGKSAVTAIRMVTLWAAEALGLQKGAIASSVSHGSHNLIIIGTNEADMAAAGNRILAFGGGLISVLDGKVLQEMPLPVGGIMTEENAETAAMQNEAVRESVKLLGAGDEAEPFMTMAFASLAVIPYLKLTTHGLVDVEKQAVVPTILSEE